MIERRHTRHTRHAIALLVAAPCCNGAASTAATEAKVAYVQAKDSASATYKAARVRAEEEAGAFYKNTLKAYTASRMHIAAANYNLDKAECGALAGNDKDVCISQAKSTLVAAQADAKADERAIEARTDARDDKRTAEYNVAREKCDAFAAAVKERCVRTAKSQYGK